MDTIYLSIKIRKTDSEADLIRENGYFFENIADALSIDRDSICEIDEQNYKSVIKTILRKFDDKSKCDKKST